MLRDIERIATTDSPTQLPLNIKERVAEACYQLSLCYVQGVGCDSNYSLAAQWLTQAVKLGSPSAQKHIYRLLRAMDVQTPMLAFPEISEWIVNDAISGNNDAFEDLSVMDPDLFKIVKEQATTVFGGMGLDIFGEGIRIDYSLDDPQSFVEKIGDANATICFGDMEGEGLRWLHYAASYGSAEAIHLLLESGICEINCTTDSCWTPLFMACAAGHFDAVMLLLDNGADAKLISETGRNCLHELQAFDQKVVKKVAKRLVEAGADVEAKEFVHGKTPLHRACIRSAGEDTAAAVEALVELNADPMVLCGNGYWATDQAAMNLRPHILRALFKSHHFAGGDDNKICLKAKAKALKHLIMQPRFFRLQNSAGTIQERVNEVLCMLISPAVIEVYIANNERGRTPLHDACFCDAGDLVEPLVSFHAIDINRTTQLAGRPDQPPLFIALQKGNQEIIGKLLRLGADITITDASGKNVLHYVVACVPHLLPSFLDRLKGISLDISRFTNGRTLPLGFTPFDFAVQSKHFECANVLLTYGSQYDDFTRLGECGEKFTALRYATGSISQMSYLLELKPSAGLVVCDNGMTIFHIIVGAFDTGKLKPFRLR